MIRLIILRSHFLNAMNCVNFVKVCKFYDFHGFYDAITSMSSVNAVYSVSSVQSANAIHMAPCASSTSAVLVTKRMDASSLWYFHSACNHANKGVLQ